MVRDPLEDLLEWMPWPDKQNPMEESSSGIEFMVRQKIFWNEGHAQTTKIQEDQPPDGHMV